MNESNNRTVDELVALLIRADSFLSLLRYRYLPAVPPDLLRELDDLLAVMREATNPINSQGGNP